MLLEGEGVYADEPVARKAVAKQLSQLAAIAILPEKEGVEKTGGCEGELVARKAAAWWLPWPARSAAPLEV